MLLGFYSGAFEGFVLLRYDAMSLDNWCPICCNSTVISKGWASITS